MPIGPVEKEIITLPIGPVEESRIWFARCRLGVAVHSCFVWGRNQHPNGHYITHLSRVLEKGSKYSCAVILNLIPMLNVDPDCQKLVSWCDCATGYRSYEFVATQAVGYTTQLETNLDINMGLEKHFKNIVDGLSNNPKNLFSELFHFSKLILNDFTFFLIILQTYFKLFAKLI